jgi:hypothetical protein
MAKIVFIILSAPQFENHHNTLIDGGIMVGQHDVHVRFLGEGEKPKYIPQSWEWLDWSHVRIPDRHIKILNDGILDESADLTVFCDDDSLTDVDHMVEKLKDGIDSDTPHIWTAWPGASFGGKSFWDGFAKHANKFMKGRSLEEMWIGWEISVMNRAFIKKSSASEEAKSIYQYSKEFMAHGDHQSSMVAWLINATHSKGDRARCEQWPNYLNYHGLCRKGDVWHVHWTGKTHKVSHQDIAKAVRLGPFDRHDELIDVLFPYLDKGIKAKKYIDREMTVCNFFAYWRVGWDQECSKKTSLNIVLDKHGQILSRTNDSKNDMTEGQWSAEPGGFDLHWNNGFKEVYRWSNKGEPVGYTVPPPHRSDPYHMQTLRNLNP